MIAALTKFCRISSADRRLFVEALLLIGFVRLGLWLVPFWMLRRILARLMRVRMTVTPLADRNCVSRISWAVTMASRYVPAATCLTQALAAKILLVREGHPSTLRLGVARSETGDLLAHAWVQSGEIVIVGGPDSLLNRYIVLRSVPDKILPEIL